MVITALNNQSILDISIQAYGSIEYAFELALANGLSLTSVLAPGQKIEVPEIETDSTDIRHYYANNNIHPATNLRQEDESAGTGSCNYCKLFE